MKLGSWAQIAILFAIMWGIWSLRYLGVDNVGPLSMLVGGLVGVILARISGLGWADIGFKRLQWRDLRISFEAAGVILLVMLLSPLVIAVFGPVGTASAVAQAQQISLSAFVFDIIVFTWIATGFGEEVFFRGLLLRHFQAGLGGSRAALALAIILQAVWFGAGHVSQNLSGMILTGLIAVGLALLFVFRTNRSIWPLAFAHAAVDTTIFSVTYFSR